MRSNLSKETFQKYLDARTDYVNGKYQLASKKLAALSLITKNDDVNHLLVKSLYKQHRYQEAERILFSDLNSYSSKVTLVYLMINVLLKNNEFIICRELIASFHDVTLRDNLLKVVKSFESKLEGANSKSLQRRAKRFYHLSSFSVIKQRVVIRQAQRLPLRKFVEIARYLLVDPFLKPIMRLSVLDIIRKMALKIEVRYRWIDHRIYVIDTSELRDLTTMSSYRKVMDLISSKYFHHPNRMLALKQTLRLDLSYLYPFNDRQIKHPELWIKIAELRLQGKQPLLINDVTKRIYYLQVKLNRLTNNLVR